MTAADHYVSFRHAVLPWTVSEDDEKRFKRIVKRVLAIVALLFLLMPWIPVPKVDRTEVQELPPQFAKLLLESKPVPPPAPPKVEKLPGTDDKQNPTKVPETAKPEPTKAPVPEARKPEPNKPPGEKLENARKKASGVGLLALKDELAEIRGAPVAVQLKQDIKQGPGVGTGVGVGVGAGTDAGIPERALITSNATNGSGGINTAGYSRNTGGGGLAGRATTLVEGVAGGGGGGGAGGGGGGGGGAGKGGTLQRGASGKASRSIEEIKLVFERNKGAIYAIYNRALRDDPSLEGKVVLELKIAPSGQVIDLRIVSSELKAADLERKLLARIRQFDFGAKDVDLMTVTWPVDFLPS
ncbi:MAG TPA: AgmX/PglI C-terminal domain-containing protein [Burkholderiaceae bacterium]|nr:AgmX/PglI C-terminal domain-containing protein [Burkholderiaceae bacterium]